MKGKVDRILYPPALWRPLSLRQDEPKIVPRLLITHTMVGSLRGTETMFKGGGYKGTESHFGLGGPSDGSNLDGVLYQWQSLDRQADAQYKGNTYATSIETSDGGNPSNPWSAKQLEALIALHVWWCHATGNPTEIAGSWNGYGWGYHALYEEWNPNGHSCPAGVRIAQLKNVVYPTATRLFKEKMPPGSRGAGRISVSDFPVFPLGAGEYFGPESGPAESVSGFHGHSSDLALWQRRMQERGWKIKDDGLYGYFTKNVVIEFQRDKGLTPDGLIGKATWDAAWLREVTK